MRASSSFPIPWQTIMYCQRHCVSATMVLTSRTELLSLHACWLLVAGSRASLGSRCTASPCVWQPQQHEPSSRWSKASCCRQRGKRAAIHEGRQKTASRDFGGGCVDVLLQSCRGISQAAGSEGAELESHTTYMYSLYVIETHVIHVH